MLNKSEFYLSALEKAKVSFGAKTDMEMAKIIKMTRSSLSHSKSRGSFPARLIMDACVERNVSLDWILGIKPKKKSNGAAE
jgi:hypothetical protein